MIPLDVRLARLEAGVAKLRTLVIVLTVIHVIPYGPGLVGIALGAIR